MGAVISLSLTLAFISLASAVLINKGEPPAKSLLGVAPLHQCFPNFLAAIRLIRARLGDRASSSLSANACKLQRVLFPLTGTGW